MEVRKNVTIPEVGQVWRSTKFSTKFVHVVCVSDDRVTYTIHGDEYTSYVDYFQMQYVYSHTKKGLNEDDSESIQAHCSEREHAQCAAL